MAAGAESCVPVKPSKSSKKLQAAYYYLSEPDDALKCLICLEVAEDPLQHEECGKLFCKKCIEKHGKNKPCPNCRTSKSQYYVDNRSK